MVQRGSRLRLSVKARESQRISGHIVRQEFQGHVSAQPRVLGLVHNAHATAAELFDDSVMRDGLADE